MTSSSLHKSAHALVDGDADFTPLLDMVGDASFVLLGEGSHGTRESSWNLRDTHMAETVDELVGYLKRQGRNPKIVIWAHNSHLGDARATEMGKRGKLNLGQLLREKYGPETVLVGFTTYAGTVTAASEWDDPGEQKRVRPALIESYESEFHDLELPGFFLNLRNCADSEIFSRPRLERAIGVIYRPETERLSHYFQADMPAQFDGVFHFDVTRAVHPLEKPLRWESGEPPETYPSGMSRKWKAGYLFGRSSS